MPSERAVALASRARASVLTSFLDASSHRAGMASAAMVRVDGPDAASFLHSQLTNDVTGLEPGAGNVSARVTRTGHLREVFTVHRLVTPDTSFRLLVDAAQAPDLFADLDGFLFADDATLSHEGPFVWLVAQGPAAATVMDAVFGPLGFEPWTTLPEGALRDLRRARGGLSVPEGAFALRRSLGGDIGFLVALPADADASALTEALAAATQAAGGEHVDADTFAEVLEVLRIEAGIPRVGPETAGKQRLLPETGLEQAAVSYTKGCYLGQEVIARVRTYGSVPHLLRALVLKQGRGTYDADAKALLGALPPPGTVLRDAESGKKLGVLASSTWSPVRKAPVALAYLARECRTPGRALVIQPEEGDLFEAEVALLPLYSAPDSAARVQQLYDLAVRTFADGEPHAALAHLEEALRLAPSFADAYEAIGVMLGRSGLFHEAIDVFRRLEEVAPDEPMVNTNLSLYYMKLGDKQTAEDEAGKATLKSMARARGKEGAGATVDEDLLKAQRRDAERKRKMFSQVLEFDPVDPIALFGMGNALLVLGEYEEAAGLLARALEVDAHNSPVYALRGKALEKLERVDEAVQVYKAGVEVASRKGDLMPLKEMEHRLLLLGGR